MSWTDLQFGCSLQDSLVLNLSQSGGSVTGSVTRTPQSVSGSGCQSETESGPISGSVSGSSITIVAGRLTLVGTFSQNNMNGNVQGSSITGSWQVTR